MNVALYLQIFSPIQVTIVIRSILIQSASYYIHQGKPSEHCLDLTYHQPTPHFFQHLIQSLMRTVHLIFVSFLSLILHWQ